MKTAYLSENGLRSSNQDAMLVRLQEGMLPLAAVSDGMGGHLGGETASALALEQLDKGTRKIGYETPEDMLSAAFDSANKKVLEVAKTNSSKSGMGATLVAALLFEDHFIAANAGDSRLYHYSKTGKLRQITVDHSFVHELVRRGIITPKQALTHPRRNMITRCIGMEDPFQADLFYIPWEKGDMLLLCSDGLWGVLEEEEIAELLSRYGDMKKQCSMLVKAALKQGSKDNITLLLVQHDGKGFYSL